MKVIIAGSKTIRERTLVLPKIQLFLDEFFSKVDEILVCGRYVDEKQTTVRPLQGVATLAYSYAQENNIKCTIFPQDWENKASSSVMIINDLMLREIKGNAKFYVPGFKGGVIFFFDSADLYNGHESYLVREAIKYGVPIYGCTFINMEALIREKEEREKEEREEREAEPIKETKEEAFEQQPIIRRKKVQVA